MTHPRWSITTFARTILRHGMPHFENNYANRGAPILSPNVERDFSDRGHLNWRHFALIRAQWKGHLVVKGVLSADDARIARDAGADAIIVSGAATGSATEMHTLQAATRAASQTPVFIGSGVSVETIPELIAHGASGLIVGTSLKFDGRISNPVDPARVRALIEVVRQIG